MIDQWERDALMHKLEDLEIIANTATQDLVRNTDIQILIAICKKLLEIAPVK